MSHQVETYDFLVVGGGIFGLTAAVELAKRKHKVGLINPDTIPHHLAASTDVSKAVRMEYGSDKEYLRMVEICIDRWKEWNHLFGVNLYQETGFLMLCKHNLESGLQNYERVSYENLVEAGYTPDRLDAASLKQRFPAINTDVYTEASYNRIGGYAQSSLTIEHLSKYAISLGVDFHLGQTASELVVENDKLIAVKTREGVTYQCGHAFLAAGPYTPLLLPELQPYMKATGHPVFWLRPEDPALFTPPNFAVFSADISNSGWYGFPLLDKHGIVKVAKHSNGMEMHPEKDDRKITDAEVIELRSFLIDTFPVLAKAPLVFTRRCLYTDTLDGHFWIDNHPEIKGLSVGTGGSGHGLKMAPLLGEMQADVAEGGANPFSQRYRWRHLSEDTPQIEEARFVVDRKI